jgi:type IV secretory pathway VirB10-like protein
MAELEETRKPRAAFGKPTWILLGVGLLAGLGGILVFMSSVSGSANHAAPPAMPRKLYTESAKTVASVAGDVTRQVNADTPTANTPQAYNAPRPAYPPRQQGQDSGAAEYWRQVRERRQAELAAPIMGIPPRWMTEQMQQQHSQVDGLAGQPAEQQLTQLLASLSAPEGAGPGTGTKAGFPVTTFRPRGGEPPVFRQKDNRRPDDFSVESGASNRWVEPLLKIFFGTTIHTTLDADIQSDLAGYVSCTVSDPVLSFDRQKVLIPQGSKVYGQTGRVEMAGQHRLGIAYEKLLLPNGGEVALANLPAQDQKGNGVGDKTNEHLLRLFGTSLAMSLIGASAEIGALGPVNGSGVDAMRFGFAAGMSKAGLQSLNRFANVPPTITIRKGHPIDVFVVGDLNLPAYPEGWQMDPHL